VNERAALAKHNRIVVKVGTTTLTHSNGKLNLVRMEKLARVLSELKNQGKEVILVSSGAIAVGTERLGLVERPRDTRGKQAAAAVGQAVLMQIYQKFFNEYNQNIAQILLTRDVFEDEIRRNNAHNTFFTLMNMGVIPIVNENDTVSTSELSDLEFRDNDTLSAYVAKLVEADILILLSDIDGLYDKNPKTNQDAKMIHNVKKITAEIEDMGGAPDSKFGTGGMETKILAAKTINDLGIDMVIASGEDPTLIYDILAGEEIGTLFMGQ
jgi:glutamate 5-kinase